MAAPDRMSPQGRAEGAGPRAKSGDGARGTLCPASPLRSDAGYGSEFGHATPPACVTAPASAWPTHWAYLASRPAG